MQQLNFISVKLTSWVVLGIVFGFYIDVNSFLLLIALSLFPIALFWARAKQKRNGLPFFEALTFLTSFCLGIWVVGISMGKGMPQHYSKKDVTKEKVWHLKVREVLKPNTFSHNYIAQIIASDNEQTTGTILFGLSVDSLTKQLQVDDEFLIHAKPRSIRPPLNPHQFDYKSYLEKQGIVHFIKSNYSSIIKKENAPKTWVGRAANFREKIISILKKYDFGLEESGVIQALLLGKRDDISENTYDNYKNAGAVHILAVSGLHVGIFLFLLEFLLSPLERLPKGKTVKLLLIVLLLWSFAFVAGLSPSIVRAVSMFSFVAYAMYLNRPTNSFNIIALSMLFILLVKPLFLFQLGFQMSYAAVFSIVWIYPKLQKFWFPENILVRKIWQLLSVSVAAQLGVLPISLFYFHQFPALFFVTNLLVVPFLGLILGFGILVIFLALIDFLPNIMAQGFDWIIRLMNATVGWVAKQESFIIKNIPFDSFQLIWGYLIITALVLFLSKPKWKTMTVFFSGLIIFQVWGIYKQVELHQKETITLAHRSRNTVLLHQLGDSLVIIASDTFNIGNIATDYSVAERIQKMGAVQLKNSYRIGSKRLFVVDSLTVLPIKARPEYLLLTQSSKINLERVLDSVQPKKIFVDGSNYPSLIKKWKATCAQKEIPFHHTGEKGFYTFKLN
ncbi:ComEC family competence protein [Muricauda ruestringensis]|uniref:ComEC/Rec2 family competence protein n=1 Tax=Flagellimonas ruestringensis TaxID=111501 RepID=UPI001CD71438|nr:ComEC/Rec2 family competence protein [Allomuricauda ruestringensis]MCA0959058.1 ComEC family competence protein [Allomuricauda ruestringensis]